MLKTNFFTNLYRKITSTKYRWEKIYSQPVMPWNVEWAEPWIVELEKKGKIAGKILDSGCGPGRTSIFLISKGYCVTGMDISSKAIEQAKRNAASKNVQAHFFQADMRKPLEDFKNHFDMVVDIGCYHTMQPEGRKRYVENLYTMTKDDAVVYLRAFDEWRLNDGYRKKCFTEAIIRDDFPIEQWTFVDVQHHEAENTTADGKSLFWYMEIKKKTAY
jgi:cyclopropane fatty-acyl-phospholipid synthase-like methyltransferase